MSQKSSLRIIVVALSLSSLHALTYDAFSASIPTGDVSALYSSYYTNLQTFLPCTLTGYISNVLDSPKTIPVGCVPYQGGSFFSTVFPLPIASTNDIVVACVAGVRPSNETLHVAFGSFRAGRPAEGIHLVLSDAAVGANEAPYNLSCIVDAAQSWNAMLLESPNVGEHISGVVVNDATVSFFGNPFNSYSDAAQSSLLWASHPGMSLLLFRTSTSDTALVEFEQVVRMAFYNLASGDFTVASPMAIQYIGEMSSASSVNSSCLADATCQPIGGLNMIGTTASSGWSLTSHNSNDSFLKTTPPGSVAIVVSSSSVGVFHDAIPAADSSASGIVAALLAVDALVRAFGDSISTNSSAPQLFAMFLVGDEYQLMGSARFVEESSAFVCHRFPNDKATAVVDCAFPNYQALNFTTVNISAIRHFIEIEQVGNASEPLRVHVNQQHNTSLAQGEANLAFSTVGSVAGSSSATFPATSPLLSFLAHNDAMSSYSLVSRYDVDYANPFLFTPSDVAKELSINAVRDAASRIASVVSLLLGQDPANPALNVNNTLASELWYCFTENFDCLSLGGSGTNVIPPNYYTSVFQYDSFVQPYQALIQSQLSLQSALAVFPTHAFSTGATYKDSMIATFGLNGNSSVWIESNWGAIGSRLAAVTSTTGYELMAFGIVLNLCVVAGLYWSFVR